MLNLIATLDNAVELPTPVLDDSETGYHLEQRLQVTAKSPVNDRTFTIEFRLGDGSDAPAAQQLTAWMEAGELVRISCSGVTARPFTHQEGKQYRSRGSEREINGKTVTLDTLLVFAGTSIVSAATPFDAEEEVRKARGAYQRQQRSYRETVNARRVAQAQATIAERVTRMKEAQAKRTAAGAGAEGPPAADGTPANNRRR